MNRYYTLVSPVITPHQQAYVSPSQAAKILSLHKNTVHRLTKNGTIPSVRMGRAVRIPLSWIYAQAEASVK